MNKSTINFIAERLLEKGLNKNQIYSDIFFEKIIDILEDDFDLFSKLEDEIQQIEFSNKKMSETQYRDLFGPFYGDE